MIRRPPFALLAAAALAAALGGCQVLKAPLSLFSTNKKDAARAANGQRIPVLLQDVTLAQAPALKGVDFTIPPPEPVQDWPTPGGGPTQSVEHVQAAADLKVAWRRRIGLGDAKGEGFFYSTMSFIISSPVAAEGRLYVLDGRSELVAIDEQTGKDVWRVDTASHRGPGREGFGGGVAFGDGRIYLTSGFRYVAAYNAATGKLIWRTPTAAPVHGAPTFVGGKLYFVDVSDQLQAMDAKTGQSIWTYQALEEPARMLIASSPAVTGEEVVAPFASGELVGVNAVNGNELWTDVLSLTNRNNALSEIRDIAARPVVNRQIAFAGSHSGVVAAVDIRSGQRLWSIPTAIITTPWVSGDVVYIVDQQGRVICAARDSGQIYWIRGLNDGLRKKFQAVYSSPILASNRLLLFSSKGVVLALNPKTGATLKTLRIGAPAFVAPIAAGPYVYVETDTGELIALR